MSTCPELQAPMQDMVKTNRAPGYSWMFFPILLPLWQALTVLFSYA